MGNQQHFHYPFTKGETVKEHPRFRDILVTKSGNIFSKTKKKLLPTHKLKGGYVGVHVREYRGSRPVHRLVAETYLLSSDHYGEQVNHINGIKTDNNVENLEWCDALHNIRHARETGLNTYDSEDHPWSVLSNEEVRKVCSLVEEGWETGAISSELNISSNIVSKIRSRASWKRISKDYTLNKKKKSSHSPQTIRAVCELLEEGRTVKEIVSALKGVSGQVVRRIRRGVHWTEISKDYQFKYVRQLEEEDVHLICKKLVLGLEPKEIADKWGYTYNQVNHIKKRNSWVKISRDYRF